MRKCLMRILTATIMTGSLFYIAHIEAGETVIEARMIQKDVPTDYEWNISYNHGLNQAAIHEGTVYVVDVEGQRMPVKLKVKDDKTLVIQPPKEGYQSGASYNLYIANDIDVENAENPQLPEQYRLHFTVA